MAFATVVDLEARWRPLTPAERTRAGVLLEDASAMVHEACPLTAAEQIEKASSLRRIVCGMVKRAMIGGDQIDGTTQYSTTTGPFTESRTIANPTGDLYLTKADRRALGCGRQVAFTVNLIERDPVLP